MPTITSQQNKAISSGFLDLMGEDRAGRQAVTFDTIAKSLAYVGEVYAKKLKDELIKKDADSSGALSDSILAHDVKIMGSIYTVEISTKKYAAFIDEGVNGWANSRGSRFSFKTKGVNPNGDMVNSIKLWLAREKKISKVTRKITVSKRESMRANITDTTTKAAISVAYMIKRQGIKPTHFWKDATTDMGEIIKAEFSAALKIDIIQNIIE